MATFALGGHLQKDPLRVSEVGQFSLESQRSSLLDREDTPGRGGALQQPVQQRASNGGEFMRTAADVAGSWPAMTHYRELGRTARM